MEQLHSVLGARSELGDNTKSITDPPGVLALCNGAPWFPPLAVTLPSRNLPLIPVTIPDKIQVIYIYYFIIKFIFFFIIKIYIQIISIILEIFFFFINFYSRYCSYDISLLYILRLALA